MVTTQSRPEWLRPPAGLHLAVGILEVAEPPVHPAQLGVDLQCKVLAVPARVN